MANTTKRASTGTTPYGDNGILYPCSSTAQTFYTNAMVGLNVSGYLDKFDDSQTLIFAGLSKEHNKIVDAGGSNGDVTLEVSTNKYITGTFVGLTAADVGKLVYASDDQTMTLSPGTYGNVIGKLVRFNSATSGTVEPIYGGQRSVKPVVAASANGAITLKEGTVFITKAGVCALTLADPIATIDDGKRLSIISVTANAHTVSNAAGSGFNAGGAGTDVGTFGGAKGDNLVVEAYQGAWYVVSKVNVTLA